MSEQTEYERFCHKIINALKALEIEYMIGGSFASSLYGEPRPTQDIDIAITLPLERVGAFVQAIQALGLYIDHEMALQSIVHPIPFNILEIETALKADIYIMRPTALEAAALERRQLEIYDPQGGDSAYFCSPEDVIIYKLIYYRQGGQTKHLRDIGAILLLRGEELDLAHIYQWAKRLDLLPVWDLALDEFERRQGRVTSDG